VAIADQIAAEAQAQGVDPALAVEVAIAESSLDQSAIGSAGEIGVFQILPATAAALGIDPTDLAQNISGGVSLLRQLLSQFGDTAKALAAYNWGSGNLSPVLSRYGAAWFAHIPSSTQNYINKILGNVQTQYQPSFNPSATLTIPPAAPSGVLTIPPAAAATPSGSTWGALALAAAIFFGLSWALGD
jgi:soluble lytic murein transglycosylase-like protein